VVVYLVHHADALGPIVDPQRPLSAVGLAQAAWLAEQAREKGARPAAIWHSGKLRGRQTAEAFLRVSTRSAVFRAVRGLQPDDPPLWMENALALETEDVLVVGHMPALPRLVASLDATARLPLHGMVALERTGPVSYVCRWVLEPPSDLPRTAPAPTAEP
jgi:phosphohistidine phosphatase